MLNLLLQKLLWTSQQYSSTSKTFVLKHYVYHVSQPLSKCWNLCRHRNDGLQAMQFILVWLLHKFTSFKFLDLHDGEVWIPTCGNIGQHDSSLFCVFYYFYYLPPPLIHQTFIIESQFTRSDNLLMKWKYRKATTKLFSFFFKSLL